MVLGLRTKSRKGPSVQVEYQVHIHEIWPWPPSQSLRALRSVVLQWAHGDRTTGTTEQVVPSIGAGTGDGRIEFNESFKLPVTLLRELPGKGHDGDSFQKNCIEFSLYETRRDKSLKGQLLGTAIIDLAEYGVIKESLSVKTPINCKRSYRNTAQSLLYLKIQPFEKGHGRSLSRDSLMRAPSMDRSVGGSVSSLMNEEYAEEEEEEAEIASFTDDDISSHSSLVASSSAVESASGSPPQKIQNGLENPKDGNAEAKDANFLQPKLQRANSDMEAAVSHTTLKESLTRSSSVNLLSSEIAVTSQKNVSKETEKDENTKIIQPITEEIASNGPHVDSKLQVDDKLNANEGGHFSNLPRIPIDDEKRKTKLRENEILAGLEIDEPEDLDATKIVKSVRSALDTMRSNGLVKNNRKDSKVYPKDTRNLVSESKISQLESRVKILEGELREAAALEVGLYSVVAEHGSSINKVHAPARRLSRLYLYACKETSKSRSGNAAKSAVSGLVLVAKACGNDVPRLTFWLSNVIVLRAIISKSPLPVLSGSTTKRTGDANKKMNGSRNSVDDSLDNWEDPRTFTDALQRVESWIFSRIIESIWWQTLTPHMQSGTAKAMRRSMSNDTRKAYKRTSTSGGEDQVNLSLELWKKAFKDACERICPVRAAGHECGCLPLLSRLIMEQCVSRLDVAMFNAVLRESADEIPTDPVSDPISDSAVLPVPPGKASFAAGAQLKNAIGNWSRWLTDLFGIDDDDESLKEETCMNDREGAESSLKPFHLLNALSDLMMLPKDMLLSKTIRKEVCPLFGPPVIRRVLNAFVPDEFCPDPVPKVVLEALNSEDTFEEAEEYSVINFPCTAAPISYVPPSATCVPGIFGDIRELKRSGSSVLKKSYTSDDELDELDSPLGSIIDGLSSSPSVTKTSWIPRENGIKNTERYRLLREVWMKNE